MLTIYELWDLNLPIIPPRSRLYQLKPVGIGTPLVESLTGYVARLAEAHCLPPGVLMERELASLVNKTYGGAHLHRIYNFTATFNGTGVMARDLIQALENLTLHNDLQFLTMLTWSELLPSRNLLRSVRAWCPDCYKKWHKSGQVVYEPLLWSLDVVKVCPYHKRNLCQNCPHCNQKNIPLAWRSRPGYCSKCGEWLELSVDTELSEPKDSADAELKSEIWRANAVGELLANACYLMSPLSRNSIAKALSAYVDQVADGNIAAFARLLEMPRNTVWLWCKGENLPSLEALVRICYCLRVSVLDFLTQGVFSANQYQATALQPTQKKLKPRARSKSFDTKQVRQYLEAVLISNESPPPSMEEVARRLECDRRTIYRHFRDLCRAISAKYVSYRKTYCLKTIEECCQEVRQIVVKLYSKGEYPTEARVLELMSKPGYFRYKKVRNALSQVRQELGL